MPRPGDYEGEMGLLSAEQVETVLSGRPPRDPVGVRAAVAVAEVRLALNEEPSPPVAGRHLAAMFEAAGAAPAVINSRRASSLSSRSRRVAAMAVAATLVLGVGIGAALTLPGGLPQTTERAKRASTQEAQQSSGNRETPVVPNTGASPLRGDEVVSERGAVISDTTRRVVPSGCIRGETLAALPSEAGAVVSGDACESGEKAVDEEVVPAASEPPGLVDQASDVVTEAGVPPRQGSAGGGATEAPDESSAEKPGLGEAGAEPGGPGEGEPPATPEPLLPIYL